MINKYLLLSVLLSATLLLVPTRAHAQFALNAEGNGFLESRVKGGNKVLNKVIGVSIGATYYKNIGTSFAVGSGLNYHFFLDPAPNGYEHGFNIPLTVNWFFRKSEDFVPLVKAGPSDNWVPFVYAGPTFEMGVGGRIVHDRRFSEGMQNRINVLAGGGVGIYLIDAALLFRLGYDYGMLDYSDNPDKVYHRHYIRLGVSVLL